MKYLPLLLLVISCNNGSVSEKRSPVNTTKDLPAKNFSKKDTAEKFDINTKGITIKLIPHPVHLQKGIDFDLNIPDGFDVSIAAEGLRRLRFMARSPDGKLFATDMYDKSDNHKGKVLIFDDWDSTTHSFKK